ncbi:MAG: UvrD-helicase domain-containing protein [Thermoanaerobaculia bacterium]|nr:UvrD-helicase domain-containing protein [Thermoanaerobaculia bacterium]
MRFYADLHVHSKYSRATSRDLDLEHLALWAKRKGIRVVGTGDFTHPAWWTELQEKLEPAEPGLYRLKPEIENAVDERLPASCRGAVRFLLEVEISTIYKKEHRDGDRTRKVHHLIYAGEMATASRFRDRLGSIGNISSDGRPILGLDSRDLLEIALESGPDAFLVPAHIWTPWFSAMGSKSGFPSIDDCYGDLSEHIFAVETGLSSDPPMNWRVSHLDRFTLISNSDAHSPGVLGREACVFDCDLDYYAMRRALETREGWAGTVEFFPEEGKYHLDGHRKCGVRLEPNETRERGGTCPSCGRRVTIGVLHRVEELADRPVSHRPDEVSPFRSLVQLPEVIAELRGVGPKSKTVRGLVTELVARLGPELEVLETVPTEDLKNLGDPLFAEAVERLRAGRVRAEGGFDGEYGTIRLFEPEEIVPQLTLAPLFGEGFENVFDDEVIQRSRPKSLDSFQPAQINILGEVEAAPKEEGGVRPSDGGSDDDGTALGGLDGDQRLATQIVEGPLLVVAGPGAGKTRTLTRRIAHLVTSGTAPERCLAVTFTRRAADELRDRLGRLLPRHGDRVPVHTFHGLGHWLLRRHAAEASLGRQFRILDEARQVELAMGCFALGRAEARRRLEELSRAVRGPQAEPAFARDLELWRDTLRSEDCVSYDDLLALPVEILDGHPEMVSSYRRRWPWISVDEYQDIDPLQYRLLRHLVPENGNVCAIGDPDQSIYRFRGADVGFFLRFRQDFPSAHVVELGRNYRSQASVVRAAERVIAPSSLAKGRRFDPASKRSARPIVLHEAPTQAAEAEFVVHTLEQILGGTSLHSFDSGRVDARGETASGAGEAEALSFDDVAVLYRTKAQAQPLAEALGRSGIPFQVRGHDRLTGHSGVRKLLQRLRELDDGRALSVTPSRDVNHWLGVVAAKEGLEGESADEALEAAALLEPLAKRHGDHLAGFLSALELGAEIDTWDPRAERVSLMTLHAAKGLEWPVVFLVGCDEGTLPLLWPKDSDDGEQEELDEERRLFFVGMTRAEDRLVLTRARQRMIRGVLHDTRPSRFLVGLDEFLMRAEGRRPKRRVVEPDRQTNLF